MKNNLSSNELEQGLIASVLIENGANFNLVKYISQEDFTNSKHQKIWSCFEKEKFDPIVINNEFNEIGQYVSDLYNAIPSSLNLEKYAEELREKTKQRLLNKTLTKFSSEIKNHDLSSDIVLSDLTNEIDYINGLSKTKMKNKNKVLEELRTELLDRDKKESDLITGMNMFDDFVKIRNGNTYTIGASTGIGKSSFTIDLALKIAQNNLESKGLIYALEMDSKDVYRKMISNLTGIHDIVLREKKYKKEEWEKIDNALSILKNVFDINVQDEYGIDIDVLVNQVTLEKIRNNISYVIVDQISLVSSKKNHENERARLKEISWKLRKLSGELNIPIIVVTQLNRGAESETASIKHVAESFDIVRDTSALILLDTERKDFSDKKQYFLNIEKNRFGKIGKIPIIGELAFSRFMEGSIDGDYDL